MKPELGIHREDVLVGLADLRMQVLHWTARHAFQLFDLRLHHNDPFDRQILAQALAENIPIVTPDSKFQRRFGQRFEMPSVYLRLFCRRAGVSNRRTA